LKFTALFPQGGLLKTDTMPTKNVTSIHLSAESRANFNMNRITFDDGTSGLEREPSPNVSNFKEGQQCEYRITHPGNNGKPDWIQFVSVSGEEKFSFDGLKDFLIVSQNAMTNAVKFIVSQGSTIGEKDLFELQERMAAQMIGTARKLCKQHC
jgi:hypothetical protein